jgi:hypothetical protein
MSLSGLNLLAANHNSGAVLGTGLKQEGGQGASSKHGSESINNLAQSDAVEQHEESIVDTTLLSKKHGSPTNIDGSEHAASGRAASNVGQSAGQEAVADYGSASNNNQSQNASVDQKEVVATNLDVDVLHGNRGYGYGGYKHGYGGGYKHGYGRPGYGGYGKGHGYNGPSNIDVNLDRHMASSDQKSVTNQDGAQVAKSDHGSESINNLAQSAYTNQEEDISVNSDVNVHGNGTQYGGPTVVNANDHTAAGNLKTTTSQSVSQTAISDNGSWSVNNMSQDAFTHQNEKVGVYTNVIV